MNEKRSTQLRNLSPIPMEPPPSQELDYCQLPRCPPRTLTQPLFPKDNNHPDFCGKYYLALLDSFDISKHYSLVQFVLWTLYKSNRTTAGPLLGLASCI